MIKLLLLVASLLLKSPLDAPREEPYCVVIYPIQDLELVTPTFDNPPELDLSNALAGGSSILPGNASQINLRSTKDGVAIISLIEELVEPEIWSDNVGKATIRYWKGNLIVNAPLSVHNQIK